MSAPLTDAEPISEQRLRNTRAWAASRPDMSGSAVIVAAIDELLALREQCERQRNLLDAVRLFVPAEAINENLLLKIQMALAECQPRSAPKEQG